MIFGVYFGIGCCVSLQQGFINEQEFLAEELFRLHAGKLIIIISYLSLRNMDV